MQTVGYIDGWVSVEKIGSWWVYVWMGRWIAG